MRSPRFVALLPLIVSLCGILTARAQRFRDLNLQAHGYATEAFIYSTNNNWNTTYSTGHGSFRWTEGVVNLTAQPTSRLRLGAQGRLFLLGTYGPKITLDWGSAEFKENDRIGFRGGKVKTPGGLLNDIQDIDPAFLWTLLPQAIYPLASRNANLVVLGGVVFGSIPLGESFGKIEYRAFGGRRSIAPDDGYFDSARSSNAKFVEADRGPAVGGNLTWHTPVQGLLVGAADDYNELSAKLLVGPFRGRTTDNVNRIVLFGRFEQNKFMVAGEYSRILGKGAVQLDGVPFSSPARQDQRDFYVMTSFRLARKLNAGAYYSSYVDRQNALTASRYQKDWTVSGRYDLSSSVYLKLEQHFLDGAAVGFSLSNNPNGLQETSRLSLAKVGVTF